MIQNTVLLLLVTSLTLPAQARSAENTLYKAVPAEQRERFAARLNAYIQAWQRNDQEELTKLYDTETLCSLCLGSERCQQDCSAPTELDTGDVEDRTALSLRVLEVHQAKYYPEKLRISLETVERIRGRGRAVRVVKAKVRLYAEFERGDWYFSLITVGGELIL